jgi:polysaccharide biosynthesis/export protein
MAHKFTRPTIALLFLLVVEVASAQTGLQQQMPGLPVAGSGVSPNRNQSDASFSGSVSELRVVPQDFAKLKLAPGFLLRLTVLDDPDFNGSFRVDEDGDISVPVIGVLHVAGQTAAEARNQVRQKLLDGRILKDPQVSLTVQEYAAPAVTIIGEVSNPGKYPLLAPRKLVDVLAMAGGPTLLAGNEVQITHSGAEAQSTAVSYSRTANPATVQDVLVQPGDTVQVKRAGVIYVLGAVNRPGGYVMQEEGTLNILQAISLAAGTNITASTGKIYLIRHNPDGTVVDMAVAYNDISKGKRSDMPLHATDILFIPTSKLKATLVNTQTVLASAASAGIYAAAIH